MSSPLIGPITAALFSGLLYTLSLPDFDLALLGWIALVPLHLAIHALPPRRAFWIGWLAGTAAFAGSMFWVITAMNQYGKVPLVISTALMLLLSAYLGFYVAWYTVACRWLKATLPSLAILGAPCIWVALEWIRTYLFSGLPWSLLGYSQYKWLSVIQIADLTSVYGVSFVLVVVNVAVAEAGLWLLQRRRLPHLGPVPSSLAPPGRKGAESSLAPPGRGQGEESAAFPWAPIATAIILVALTLFYGFDQLSRYRDPNPPATATQLRTLRVGLVQANIDQSVKWDQRYRRATQERYAKLTAQAGTDADLVIWPEAATPFLFELEPEYRAEIASLIKSTGVPLLFGSPTLGYHPDRRPFLMNSAYLLSPDDQILGRYSKRHLVPFGEYIPLHDSVLFFLDKLVEGIGDFQAGREATVLAVPEKDTRHTSQVSPELGRRVTHETLSPSPPPLPEVARDEPAAPSPASLALRASMPRFGVVICYEVIFPNEVREFAARGADFMVTITNDAWFGRSSAPYQHFGMVVLRAVENRVSFARAANTGVSGFIDPTGRILETTPIFTEAAVTRTIPVARTPTFYTKYGDVFAYACVIIAGILLVIVRFQRKRAVRGTSKTR